MEKLKNIGEQPYLEDATSATDVGIDYVSPDSQDGSPLGKFKNVESLLEAYNNLHSEFTKKCQAFNELKKQLSCDNVDKTPQFAKENWQNKVDEFLKLHPSAKNHSKLIADMLSSDKELASSEYSLEVAYARVLEDENKKLTSCMSDENYILNSITPNIKDKIVREYLKEVNKNMPFLINSKGGTNVITSYKKPTNMLEAKEMATKIFN